MLNYLKADDFWIRGKIMYKKNEQQIFLSIQSDHNLIYMHLYEIMVNFIYSIKMCMYVTSLWYTSYNAEICI